MIYLLAALAMFCVALYVQTRSFERERKEWTRERQLLITRIQHPEIIVAGPEEEYQPDDTQFMTSEPDDIDLVGTVQTNG